jgi:hypothetical protein
MVRAKREDERLLSRDEQHLVAQTRPPIIRKLAGHDLVEVTRQLRECRDRGREAGRYKREELVDQMAASGAATFDSAARRAKDTLLSGALKRANKETERRRVMDTHNANVSNAKHALTTKRLRIPILNG